MSCSFVWISPIYCVTLLVSVFLCYIACTNSHFTTNKGAKSALHTCWSKISIIWTAPFSSDHESPFLCQSVSDRWRCIVGELMDKMVRFGQLVSCLRPLRWILFLDPLLLLFLAFFSICHYKWKQSFKIWKAHQVNVIREEVQSGLRWTKMAMNRVGDGIYAWALCGGFWSVWKMKL